MTGKKKQHPPLSSHRVPLTVDEANEGDVAALAALRTGVADRLTREFGPGHWSSPVTERAVLRGLTRARVLIARADGRIVGTLRLVTKKPWAIDPSYFRPVARAIYLLDMAVDQQLQRLGIGRRLVEAAISVAGAWPGEAIRLDAYDAPAGAGPFYEKCGFTEVGRVVYRSTPLLYYELIL